MEEEKEVQSDEEINKRCRELLTAAQCNIERCEDLMQRRSSRKWEPAKVARMVRRLESAKARKDEITSFMQEMESRRSRSEQQ
jgi:hypothetical protein